MKSRLFIGTVTKKYGGVKQLKKNFLEGPREWFGNLDIGDLLLPSEDSEVNKLLKVMKIEDVDNGGKRYYFVENKKCSTY